MTSTIVSDRASVIAALSRRAAEILARHGYPEMPLTGDIGLGMLPIADMAALASSPGPRSTDDLTRKAQAARDALQGLYFSAAEEGSPLEAAVLAGAKAITDLLGLVFPTPDGVTKERGEDGRRPDGPGLSHSVSSPSVSPAAAASIPGAQFLPWPSDCFKPSACSRHGECVYGLGRACRHHGYDLSADIASARDQRAEREDAQRPRPEAASPIGKAEAPASIVLPPSSQESGVGETEEWRPIETAPRNATTVLLGWYDKITNDPKDWNWIVIAGWYEAGPADRCWYDILDTQVEPTHWMSLPSAPRPSQREG